MVVPTDIQFSFIAAAALADTLPYDDRKVPEPYYMEANGNFYSAIKELRVKNFHEAERLVGDAYASLAECYKAYASVISSNTTTNVP